MDEKIEEKIRIAVLERDRAIKEKKDAEESLQSTIEALTEITDVPRHEVEKIANSVQQSAEKKNVSLFQRIKSLAKSKLSNLPRLFQPFKSKAFRAHFRVYCIVNALLIFINLRYSPSVPWFHFPLFGWGAGLLSHYLHGERWSKKALSEKGSESPEQLPVKITQKSFKTDLANYIMINTMLIITDIAYSPGVWWSVYPLLGWGALLAAHHAASKKEK